jgi:hypothetical protein
LLGFSDASEAGFFCFWRYVRHPAMANPWTILNRRDKNWISVGLYMAVIYAHLPQAIISLLAFLAGSLLFSASQKERTSFDVPLFPPHTKAVLGGSLLLCSAAVAISIFVSR